MYLVYGATNCSYSSCCVDWPSYTWSKLNAVVVLSRRGEGARGVAVPSSTSAPREGDRSAGEANRVASHSRDRSADSSGRRHGHTEGPQTFGSAAPPRDGAFGNDRRGRLALFMVLFDIVWQPCQCVASGTQSRWGSWLGPSR